MNPNTEHMEFKNATVRQMLDDNQDYAGDETPIELTIVIPQGYYEPVFGKKELPPFKRKGFMRRRH